MTAEIPRVAFEGAEPGPILEPRVFIVHEPRTPRDLESATRYGELVILLPREVSPALMPRPAYDMMRAKFRETGFDPKVDYIVYTGGDPTAMLILGLLMRSEFPTLQRVKYLRWDRDVRVDPLTGDPIRTLGGKVVRDPTLGSYMSQEFDLGF
jgi:hypothetical protein